MASLKQRLDALEATAPAAGASVPTEIWLAAPAGLHCPPVLLWRAAGAHERASHADA